MTIPIRIKPDLPDSLVKVNVTPGDVIVVRCQSDVSNADAHEIKTRLAAYFPDVPIVVLRLGMKLDVISTSSLCQSETIAVTQRHPSN